MKIKNMVVIIILSALVTSIYACSGGNNSNTGGHSAPDNTANNNSNNNGSSGGTNSGSNGTGEQTRTTDLTSLIQPSDFQYLGAFRLPGEEGREGSFSYGGEAMAYYPGRNSLYISGHTRLPYGEFPNGNQVAEISIPSPVISKNIDDLPTANFLQGFSDVTGGLFNTYEEIVRMGLVFLSTPITGEKFYLCFGQHFHEDPSDQTPTHAWFNPNLSSPDTQGAWYIGNKSFYSVNGYMFEIPESIADNYLGGRRLATGRYRDGGWSGQGPQIYAVGPWLSGNPPANNTRLSEIPLLEYASSQTDTNVSAAVNNYQHADEWEGGVWATTSSGKSSVVFVGTKGTGAKYWYGWVNPRGPQYPCIETAFRNDFITCRNADQTPCGEEDLNGCEGHNDFRGWWSSRFDAQILFYDPANLTAVAQGTMQPYQPQPYAILDIDNNLILAPTPEDTLIGTGDQRRFRVSEAAYDRTNNQLYILELFADGTKPIVHAWKIN